MRRVFLDTETTGLDPDKGHRIVEIAAVAYENRVPVADEDGGAFHAYLNPQREVEDGARDIHGLDDEFLAGKPLFADIAARLAAFIKGAEVVIHNAEFDRAFLDAEFKRLNMPPVDKVAGKIVCSLQWSRQNNAGVRAHSLDALCERFGVDTSARTAHSAMLDTQLLAKVYYQMVQRQGEMDIPARARAVAVAGQSVRVLAATAAENAAHEKFLRNMAEESAVTPLFLREDS